MPKALLDFLGYSFFFWSRESGEPIHIHVSKGVPSKNCAKFWIKPDAVELAHNDAQIPPKELKKIRTYIATNTEEIITAWYRYFGTI